MELKSIMIGSDQPQELADFYTKIFGEPDMKDDENHWYGFTIGAGGLMIGAHSEVKGQNDCPGRLIMNIETPDVKAEFDRIKATGAKVVAEPYQPKGMPEDTKEFWLATFADPDNNYFQLATPWEPPAK